MRNLLLSAALALALSGCSVLASKEASVGCQAADAVTTVAALSAGATEANPLVAGIISSTGVAGFLVFKLVVALALYHYHEEVVKTPAGETALAGVNVVTCGAALNNLLLLL